MVPLGLLATAVVFDIIRAVNDVASFAVASYYMIAAGVVGGLLAAVFGLVDWLAVPAGTRAKRVGLWQGAGNVVVVALFAVSWPRPEHPDELAQLVLGQVPCQVRLADHFYQLPVLDHR